MTTMTIPDVGAAVDQWQDHRTLLASPVILAVSIDGGNYQNWAVHILALRNLHLPAGGPIPKTGIRKIGRTIVGADEPTSVLASEACFCATRATFRVLTFQVWMERHRQHRYQLPTCGACLRACGTLTGLPTDLIRGVR